MLICKSPRKNPGHSFVYLARAQGEATETKVKLDAWHGVAGAGRSDVHHALCSETMVHYFGLTPTRAFQIFWGVCIKAVLREDLDAFLALREDSFG
jgi:hypothetical protein